MIFPMIVGKLVGGVTAVFFAMMIAPPATIGHGASAKAAEAAAE
jgi:ethanolamine transporter